LNGSALTIPGKIQSVITEHAEQPFLIDAVSGQAVTYQQMLQKVLSGAAQLQAGGVRRGDRIALYLPNSVEFVFTCFACLYAGVTVVPLNLALSPKEREFALTHSGVKAAVYAERTVEIEQDIARCMPDLLCFTVGTGSAKGQCLDYDSAAIHEAFLPGDIDETAVLPIHFTSGTTGLPKAVVHTVGSLFGNAWSFNEDVSLDQTCRFLHVMPMAYMAGFLNTILCPFMAGGSVVLAPQFDARTVLNFWQPVVQYDVNTIWMSPTMLISLNRLDRS